MSIPDGFKVSEVGVIPEDWDVYSIEQLVANNIIDKPLDGNHGNIHPKNQDYVSDGIPFIMANNVHDGILDLKNCNFLRKEQADNLQKGFSILGDVLLTHKGTVGNVTIVSNIVTPYIMLTPQVTYYRVKDKNRITNTFIRYFFESKKFQSILQNLAGGGTRAYIGITQQRKLPFILPPLAEQKAIAQSLSDVDNLITAIDKLITKKRNIKQGTMQELLTGKKRLSGFTGEWDVKKLGELGYSNRPTIKAGPFGSSLKKEFYVKKGYKIYGQEQVIAGDLSIGNYYIDFDLFEKLKSCEIRPNDILISLVGTFGKVMVVPDNIERGIINPRLIRLSLNANLVYSYFLQYWLISSDTQKLLSETSHGGTMGIINAKVLSGLNIPLPPLPEQKVIAKILTEMDEEIEALEKKREKYKNIKQGMMQQLLTGKTRLKINLEYR